MNKEKLNSMSLGVIAQKNDSGIKEGIAKIIKLDQYFSLSHELQEIPQMFTGDSVPKLYVNNLAHWGGNMSDEKINKTLPDGTKKITHLDLDLGKNGLCSMRCPGCFKCIPELKNKLGNDRIQLEEIQETILKFKELGLKTIKILGPGEPFCNKEIIPFLEWAHENGIGVSVFTKGFEIGNDKQVERLFGEYGIHNSEEMAKKLKELDVSVLVGLHSFDNELQKRCVGYERKPFGEIYIKARNNAIVQLIRAGLNEYIPGKPTRLGISAAPLRTYALEEYLEIYKWARLRNIYPIGCPSNNSGLGEEENNRISRDVINYEERLINLYTNIYIWNIEHGVMTINEFLKDGVSIYPGAYLCKQVRTGGYMRKTDDGGYEMVACPGHNTNIEELRMTKDKDLLTMSLEEIRDMRRNSFNYKLGNYHCIARDGISLSTDFYDRITENVKSYFGVK